ncbi:MAG: Omp28-related outer membrane protein [Bacteroidetes bacterium]|nr:Omp28-related outer membrane protein [Bacteroidota bacterium]
MKKFVLSSIFLFAVLFSMAQVPRTMVAVEDGTGTWCQYCPGAAMGCDDLLSHGCFVAVIANHNGDSYANNYSNNRNSMWGITGYPTVTFDGNLALVGGNHTTSLYTSYLPKYNQSIAITSPVTLSWEISNTGLNYTVVVTLEKVGTITSVSNKLFFFVTQSNIMQNWQGQTHLEHVNRLMVPDENGTTVDFTSGTTQTVTLNFTMDAAWPLADCEFICFLQNKDAGQGTTGGVKKWVVYNSIKRGVIDLNVDFAANQTNVAKGGTVNFTNNTTGGYIGTSETYLWSFPGGTPYSSTDENPTVVYSECGTHDVQLIVNRGGQIDTVTKVKYIQVGPVVNVLISPNDTACNYTPITLDATTPNATYLWAPGGETTPTITVNAATVGLGSHMYAVTVSTPDGCEQYMIENIFFDDCTGIGVKNGDLGVSLYPNPNSGTFNIEMNSLSAQNVTIEVMNSMGMKVYAEKGIPISGKSTKTITLKNAASGVYYVAVQGSGKKVVEKILVK